MSIKAREIPNFPNPIDEKARFFGQPGDMIRSCHSDESFYGFLVACPNCGRFGSLTINAREGPNWKIISGIANVGGKLIDAGPGDINDVTTLSLEPSILKGCCGWHGYLRHGVFEQV